MSLAPIGSSCCRSGEVKNDVKPAIEGTRVDLLAHQTSDPREKDEADVRRRVVSMFAMPTFFFVN